MLILDQFGNYLIQTVLTTSTELRKEEGEIKNPSLLRLYATAREAIYSLLQGKVRDYSCHKFASNVVERALILGNIREVQMVVEELVADQDAGGEHDSGELLSLADLINDKFGNYVVQRCIDVLSGPASEDVEDDGLKKKLKERLAKRLTDLSKHFKDRDETQSKEEKSYAKHVFSFIDKKLPGLNKGATSA